LCSDLLIPPEPFASGVVAEASVPKVTEERRRLDTDGDLSPLRADHGRRGSGRHHPEIAMQP
jgi:hypothetical protein